MNYIYRASALDSDTDFNIKQAFLDYVTEHHIDVATVIKEPVNKASNWHKTLLYNLVNEVAEAGDEILVYDAPQLARSILQICDILNVLQQRRISVHFVKYAMSLDMTTTQCSVNYVTLFSLMTKDLKSYRTLASISRRKVLGLHVGRPKGRKNKQLKLDA